MEKFITTASADIRDLLISTLSAELRIAPQALAPDRTFASYGADSLTAMTVAVELEDTLGIGEIPPTLMWDCPTIDTLVPALEALRRRGETEIDRSAA
jgi:acyl carrier protein